MQKRALTGINPESPALRWKFLFLALGAMAASAVLFIFDPAQCGFYPLCLFHQSTGLLCPGCGSLRALHTLLHGNLEAAMRYNAVLVAGLPLAAWLLIRWVKARMEGRQWPPVVRPVWIWCGLAVLVIFGILRNLI